MGRINKKPHYDAKKIMNELVTEVSKLYISEKLSLRELSREFNMSVGKITKLLITAGVYHTDISDEVLYWKSEGLSVDEISNKMGIKKTAVNGYLPYSKIPYNAKEISQNAERIAKYRKRKQVVASLQEDMSADKLWTALMEFQGYQFLRYRGLKFSYYIKGGELFVDRKAESKTITRSSVNMAFENAIIIMQADGFVKGPKKLGTFGASYLYPIFIRFEIIVNKDD